MPDFENLASLGGTVVTVIVFIWYLMQKDKQMNETFNGFNRTITNHLAHALEVEKQITKSLTNLTGCISDLSKKQENRTRTIDRRHEVEMASRDIAK
jgi:uncharacterized damage-inducible protein DinB